VKFFNRYTHSFNRRPNCHVNLPIGGSCLQGWIYVYSFMVFLAILHRHIPTIQKCTTLGRDCHRIINSVPAMFIIYSESLVWRNYPFAVESLCSGHAIVPRIPELHHYSLESFG